MMTKFFSRHSRLTRLRLCAHGKIYPFASFVLVVVEASMILICPFLSFMLFMVDRFYGLPLRILRALRGRGLLRFWLYLFLSFMHFMVDCFYVFPLRVLRNILVDVSLQPNSPQPNQHAFCRFYSPSSTHDSPPTVLKTPQTQQTQ